MPEFDLILAGGRVLSSSADWIADIGVTGGHIAAVGDLSGADGPRHDIAGRIVTPGGVDVHCHIEQVSGMGQMNADTFETATVSALHGGTTTTISFAPQAAGKTLDAAIADYTARAERGAATDHAFHLIVNDTSIPDFEAQLHAVVAAGHRSIKIFTTYNIGLSDREILDVLAVAKDAGALVCVHAENDAIIGWTRQRLLEAGRRAPKWHAVSRPRLAEIEAVQRMIHFAEFFATPVMLFHISTKEAVDTIRAAKTRGAPVWAETCPHYLLMSDAALDRPGMEGAKWMCSPPQRNDADSEALWHGLADGTLSVVSSDHAPYRYDASGKLSAGLETDFSKIANGLPGLETRMPLMFDRFLSGQIDGPAFVRANCSDPARLYGLAAKGDIDIGKDADLVIWDPERRVTFGENDLHDNVGYNPWVGRTVQGWPETVFLRGSAVIESGAFTGRTGNGQWIDRPAIGARTDARPAAEYEATL